MNNTNYRHPLITMERIAAFFGFLGVALGAFGAHALGATLLQHGMIETWKTASFYHLIHSVALLCVASMKPTPRLTCWFFIVGILLFSGSLYLLAYTNIRWFGVVTPLGGICLLLGWLSLVFVRYKPA